jgi:hypothetical protein
MKDKLKVRETAIQETMIVSTNFFNVMLSFYLCKNLNISSFIKDLDIYFVINILYIYGFEFEC